MFVGCGKSAFIAASSSCILRSLSSSSILASRFALIWLSNLTPSSSTLTPYCIAILTKRLSEKGRSGLPRTSVNSFIKASILSLSVKSRMGPCSKPSCTLGSILLTGLLASTAAFSKILGGRYVYIGKAFARTPFSLASTASTGLTEPPSFVFKPPLAPKSLLYFCNALPRISSLAGSRTSFL